jgi:8-oxo-dGTP pyrophosphatase MutT (NUDIX family)
MERSFGVIPFVRLKDEIKFLLIQHLGGHWAFPKGHADPGEEGKPLVTALREFEEETGIESSACTLKPGWGSFSEFYSFKRKGVLREKESKYFLGEVDSIEVAVNVQASEIETYCWAGKEEAMKILTFEDSKLMLEKAHEAILKNVTN